MVKAAASRGYRNVLGSVYPFDAQHPFTGLSRWLIRRNIAPGAILVLHDGPERGARTAEILRHLLPELSRQGFEVVSVSELLDRGGGADRPARTAARGWLVPRPWRPLPAHPPAPIFPGPRIAALSPRL